MSNISKDLPTLIPATRTPLNKMRSTGESQKAIAIALGKKKIATAAFNSSI